MNMLRTCAAFIVLNTLSSVAHKRIKAVCSGSNLIMIELRLLELALQEDERMAQERRVACLQQANEREHNQRLLAEEEVQRLIQQHEVILFSPTLPFLLCLMLGTQHTPFFMHLCLQQCLFRAFAGFRWGLCVEPWVHFALQRNLYNGLYMQIYHWSSTPGT